MLPYVKKIVLILVILILELVLVATFSLQVFINIFKRGGTGFTLNNIASIYYYSDKHHTLNNKEKDLLTQALKNMNIFQMEDITIEEICNLDISYELKDGKSSGYITLYIDYNNKEALNKLITNLNLEGTETKDFAFYTHDSIILSYNPNKKNATLSLYIELPLSYNILDISNKDTSSSLTDYFLSINETNRIKLQEETKNDIIYHFLIFLILNIILFIFILLIKYIMKSKHYKALHKK